MRQLPLVTFGVTNYNHERFIIETLDSIKAQTYANTELLIIDDCSTDGSPALIREWLKTYNKPCTFIARPANAGIAAGVTDILNKASGKYLSLVASDDVLLPYKTEEQVALLEAAGDGHAMVYGDLIEIDEDSNIVAEPRYTIEKLRSRDFVPPSGDIFREVLKGIFFYNQSALINLPLFRKSGFIYDKKVMPDDWDLQLTLSRNCKVIASPKPYVKYRVVSDSFSHTYLKKQNLHKLYESIIYMLMKYRKHPLNTAEDKQAIMDRAREIYWYLKRTPAFNRRDQIKYDLLFFKKTFALRDLLAFLKSTAGYMVGAKQFKPADDPPAA